MVFKWHVNAYKSDDRLVRWGTCIFESVCHIFSKSSLSFMFYEVPLGVLQFNCKRRRLYSDCIKATLCLPVTCVFSNFIKTSQSLVTRDKSPKSFQCSMTGVRLKSFRDVAPRTTS